MEPTPLPDIWEPEDDPLEVPISAIEHYSYCRRQCALIHVEQTFDENLYTIRGRLQHERVDSNDGRAEHGIRVIRSMPLWSALLQLRGRADVVEFRTEGPYPIEYKSGPYHKPHADLQLCAQALCLEEMLGITVPRGAVYSQAERRRHEVELDHGLREATLGAIEGVRTLLREQRVPEAPNDARCRHCSLIESCLPSVVGEGARLRGLQGGLYHAWDLAQDEGESHE